MKDYDNEKPVCNGCGDKLEKGHKYIKIGDIIFCEYCINENWNEGE